MNINGSNFTNFQHLRVKGDSGGPGAVRFVANSSSEGTLSLSPTYVEGSKQWLLPTKSGGIGITGTFSVDLPAITSWSETAVTVSGIRREDALIVQVQDMTYTVTTGRTFPIIAGARPENGYVYLTLYNPTGTATIAGPTMVCAYTAFR